MAPRIKRPMYGPGHPKGQTVGKDVQIMKFGVHRYETGLLPKPVTGFTEQFGPALKEALVRVIQPREGIDPTGNIGQATFDVLWEYLDGYRRYRYRLFKIPAIPKPNPVPDLGPVYVGGASILQHDLTHRTSGFPNAWDSSLYPAFDDGWVGGRTIIAPENMVITDIGSAIGGLSIKATGKSGIRYWFGHVAQPPSVGTSVLKGNRFCTIAYMSRAHVHVGIDARALIRRELAHRTDYSHGAPTVGSQLREYLSLAA